MLLYPMNGTSLHETFDIQGHPVTLATINLAQPWPLVAHDLLGLIQEPKEIKSSQWA